MAQTKNSKRSSGSSRGTGSRSAAGRSGSRRSTAGSRQAARLAKRRAERNHLIASLVLLGLGLLVLALVLVRGQSGWRFLHNGLFGLFGVVTYLVGPLLLYLAYLVASGYSVAKFSAKVGLMAILCTSVPVVFSDFTVRDEKPLELIRMLFERGQSHYWSGGVLGGAVGVPLLAFCGRPGANILMILVLLIGLMVFFAVTPVDVVQFAAYYVQRIQHARADREAERTAYDTPLFAAGSEEEPLENLTDALPEPPVETPAPQHHPAFDIAPYLAHHTAGKPAGAAPAAPAAPVAPAAAPAVRSDFDVDLGPQSSQQAMQDAFKNDPLEPVVIGPGGTFGLDPLSQLGKKSKPAAPAADADATGEFTLHLEPELAPAGDAEAAELDELIRKAMGNLPSARDAEGPLAETHIDLPPTEPAPTAPLPADTFDTELEAVPQQEAPSSAPAAIPVLDGSFEEDSFDAARAAWESGTPMAEALAAPAPSMRYRAKPAPPAQPPAAPAAETTVPEPPAEAEEEEEELPFEPKLYVYPSLDLFNVTRPEDEAGAAQEMKRNADILVNTLDSFGVKTRILDICRGPSVTRYELQPQAGIKVSRITSLADDIALNLAAAGVRIEAPIPGKPAVGIEVPNKIRATVNIRTVFESTNYINMRSPLTMALGKDIAGVAQVADLCRMPHLLIAGSTGSGKSVCVNSIIVSFLFRSGPEDVKLLLIDPKVVELAEYNGIPHLLMPVVTEPRKAAGALGASVAEMERRYKLFADHNVREIKAFNKLAESDPLLEHLPYIAIVIDELADLMMVAGKEVEDYICRIAQKARAAGIHLIVATQRPSVDVITGLIKANIPSRIAFAVSSQVDSRTILDSAGAEKLLGNGDMLFLPVGAAKPLRVQGTFVTDEEIAAVLNFIKSTSDAQYDEEMIAEMERRAVAEKGARKESGDEESGAGLDAMFEQAVECVIEAGQASTSLLQRRCKLGYARAARIMDQMEQEKIIGPYEGAKPRSVLITMAQWQERKLGAGGDA